MRRAGREFGSEHPKVIYVALRWNDLNPLRDQEQRMIRSVAKKLKLRETDLRIFNLCPPMRGMGMDLTVDELWHVEKTVQRIKECVDTSESVQRIVVGGRSGPMPLVALMLKLLVNQVGIEIRYHHKARAVSGGSLNPVRVLRRDVTKAPRSKFRMGLANPAPQRTPASGRRCAPRYPSRESA